MAASIRSVFEFNGAKVHERAIKIEDGSIKKLSAAALEMKKDSDAFLTPKIQQEKEARKHKRGAGSTEPDPKKTKR
eukprot:CAMPEP_0167777086 /NCGR_PEP_ID=MMETSP0111_2-20121227/3493_1 /TAXON_ID=91324 /ORGANISM="Lotharella globosa, Strain CCCM811" /LENGTH=75 /DNA_ID=CAMNT_0007667221 /DNA_START=42 /DNA_END=269 /DNA_ORIENTATION=+